MEDTRSEVGSFVEKDRSHVHAAEERDRLLDEVHDLQKRLDATEKANVYLERENEELKEQMTGSVNTGMGATRTSRATVRRFQCSTGATGKDNDEGEAGFQVDEEKLYKDRYRLLWQNAIRFTMAGVKQGKLVMVQQGSSIVQGRLEQEKKEVTSLRASLLEVKKMQEAQALQMDQKNQTIKDLRAKLDMDRKNTAKEKALFEEQLHEQALRVTCQNTDQGSLEKSSSAPFGLGQVEESELHEQIEELENHLVATRRDKEALLERIEELQDEDLQGQLAELERELVLSQKAESEWRDKAMLSWWQRLNALCVVPPTKAPRNSARFVDQDEPVDQQEPHPESRPLGTDDDGRQ